MLEIKNTHQEKEIELMNSYYMKELEFFDGESFITFTIYELNPFNKRITIAASSQGRISIDTYDLLEDNYGYFFEYGYWHTKQIYISDFE